jgi:single-strand DNA-binding protein
MARMCSVQIMGNVGGDPEQKYNRDGAMSLHFSVATDHSRKQADGSYSDQTEWFRCTAFGRQAEALADKITKGQPLYVQGRFRIEHWTGQDGQPRTSYTVLASEIVLLERRAPAGENGQGVPVGAGAPSRGAAPRGRTEPDDRPQDIEDLPF